MSTAIFIAVLTALYGLWLWLLIYHERRGK